MVEHPIECVFLPAPPGCDGWKFELLAKQIRRQVGKKGHNRGRLNQTAPQCIGNLNISSDDGVDQAGHTEKRFAPQLERIAKAIVDPAQNDIDLLQPIYGLQIYAPIAHGKIRSFDQGESQVSRDIRVFEVGLVVWSRGQQDDSRIVALGEVGKCFALSTEEGSQTQYVRGTEEIGQNIGDNGAVL